MDTQVQNETTMQYGHMPERRDSNLSNLDSNVSTPFQPHQGLGHALGIPHTVGGRAPYQDNYPISPPPHVPNGGPSQQHPGTSHNLTYQVGPGQASSPGLKRKPIDGLGVGPGQMQKRRRDVDDTDQYDVDGGGQGAKHWTDDEKSKLFTYLMGRGQDDHWQSLKATKNSCLRECSSEVFGGKKTYQALKGCYERNVNLYKQINSFERFQLQSGNPSVKGLAEADRLREYERRLQTARKSGIEVGNIAARTVDHWHQLGWYDLFYSRMGDQTNPRPSSSRNTGGGQHSTGLDEPDDNDDLNMDFDTSPLAGPSGMNGIPHERSHNPVSYINPQNLREGPSNIPNSPVTPNNTQHQSTPVTSTSAMLPPTSATSSSSDQTVVNVSVTQGMISTYLQFLQVQTQTSKMKVEYMRRREEREEKESTQRREVERLRQERELAEFEHTKQSAMMKQKADRAIELLSNPSVDSGLRQAASDYLRKLFTSD
ncbi:hypothetical protein EYR40_007948 [Pleurotus pulmonarius]|nr:hypothetical protein EYR36_008817 [Pleurotus pulmonarius]KAF4596363.1 hypothetical protein EYR38_007743 [Pleurotus pulmonarius]KAF4597489.1 hypothetical protein EYR40_007948 [Pleurotus pulmonarius]